MRTTSFVLFLLVAGAAAAERPYGRDGRSFRDHRSFLATSLYNATDHPIEFTVRFAPEPQALTYWIQPGQVLPLRGPSSAQACEVAFTDRSGAARTARLAFDRVSGWRSRDQQGPLHSFVRHHREIRVVAGRARTDAENATALGESIAGLVTAIEDAKHGHRIQVANNSGGTVLLRLRYRSRGDAAWRTVGTWTFKPGEVSFLAHENRQLRTRTPVLYFSAEEVGGPRVWDGPVQDLFEGRMVRFREYRRAPDPDGILRLPIDR